MKTVETKILFVLFVTFLLVLMLGGFFRIKAEAETSERCISASTDAAETLYRKEIKNVLKDAGAANAGVTLTKKCMDGKTLEYLVEVNLPKYIDFNAGRENALREALSAINLNVDNSNVTFSFS